MSGVANQQEEHVEVGVSARLVTKYVLYATCTRNVDKLVCVNLLQATVTVVPNGKSISM